MAVTEAGLEVGWSGILKMMMMFDASVFSRSAENKYVRDFLEKSAEIFKLRDVIQYGLRAIRNSSLPDLPLSSFFFRLSEAPGIDGPITNVLHQKEIESRIQDSLAEFRDLTEEARESLIRSFKEGSQPAVRTSRTFHRDIKKGF